jgi:DHA1 family multidrug resistance protein-like MFS transporter
MSLYTLFILGQAVAPNMQTLLVTRFFSGFFACAPLSNSGGLIADMWDGKTRGLAMNLLSTMISIGPVLGPIVAGFMVYRGVNWRWIFWVMMIFAGACTLLTIVLLPETYAPRILEFKVRCSLLECIFLVHSCEGEAFAQRRPHALQEYIRGERAYRLDAPDPL